jgi:hypothetical protein
MIAVSCASGDRSALAMAALRRLPRYLPCGATGVASILSIGPAGLV